MKTRIAAFALSILVSLTGLQACFTPVLAFPSVPEAVLKKPVAVVEDSVSTYVPSAAAPGNGIAVNIIFPEKARYKAGAPIAIVVNGNELLSLQMSMHAANSGIAEVRFAYPGKGTKLFHSDGIFDNFGDCCSTALKDVILFMKGESNDYKGRSVREIIPVPLDQSVVGLVAWETGANLALVTMAKFKEKIPFISYLAFFEGAAGAMFFPDCLGTVKDLSLNRHYKEGSAATGQILVDYRKLMFSPNAKLHPGVAKRKGDTEIPGVLYFDENGNKQWDEQLEYPIPYASEVGLDKQIYAPPVTEALIRHTVFVKSLPKPPEKKDDTKDKDGKDKKDKDKAKKDNDDSDTDSQDDKKVSKGKDKGDSKDQGDGDEKTASKKPKKQSFLELLRWPRSVATLAESKAYFESRDGSLYVKEVCEAYPKLLVGLFGAVVGHTQRQPDHPHIALLYNQFLDAKPRWMRLNPEPVYVSTLCRSNIQNFQRQTNEPNSTLDAANIISHLAPLGLVPEYAWMDALVAELSDRSKSGNLKSPLDSVLSEYTPIADPSKVEPEKPDSKPGIKPKTVGAKEAAGNKDDGKASP